MTIIDPNLTRRYIHESENENEYIHLPCLNSFVGIVSTIFFTRSCSDFTPKRSWRTLEGHEVKSDLKFRDLRLDIAFATGQTLIFNFLQACRISEHSSFPLVKIRNLLQKIEMALSRPILALETSSKGC